MQGAGTQSNPYIIQTPQDLDAIRNNLSAYYELANDIDMSGWGNWSPIAPTTANRFTGFIDGKGHKIINLTIVNNAEYNAFIGNARGDISGGYIKNLGLENVYSESNSPHLAGLIGLNYKTTISNCYVTGTIKQTDTTKLYTGGLVGRSFGLIENCFTACNVIGGSHTGGFVGYFADQSSIVKNNYSKSTVTGTSDTGVFYGRYNTITGYQPTFLNNFFDKDVAGTTNYQTTGVTAKTTQEMKTQSTFTGWDFDNVWYMEDYPKLRVFANIPTAKKETITVNSYTLPSFSDISKTKKSTKQLNTFSNAIQTLSERHVATIRINSTYLSQINTNATKSSRTVRSGTATVNSFIKPIHSFAYRESKTIKQLLSSIKPLHTNVSVKYPLNNKVVNAYVSVIQNPSIVSEVENCSEVQNIQNPSYSEVIK